MWQHFGGIYPEPQSKTFGGLINSISELTKPDERVEVWGNVSLIPFLSQREGCSRFIDKRAVTGYYSSPGKDMPFKKSGATPIATHVEWFVADLKKCKPAIFIDMSEIFPVLPSPFAVDVLGKYLDENYFYLETIDKSRVYRTR